MCWRVGEKEPRKNHVPIRAPARSFDKFYGRCTTWHIPRARPAKKVISTTVIHNRGKARSSPPLRRSVIYTFSCSKHSYYSINIASKFVDLCSFSKTAGIRFSLQLKHPSDKIRIIYL